MRIAAVIEGHLILALSADYYYRIINEEIQNPTIKKFH